MKRSTHFAYFGSIFFLLSSIYGGHLNFGTWLPFFHPVSHCISNEAYYYSISSSFILIISHTSAIFSIPKFEFIVMTLAMIGIFFTVLIPSNVNFPMHALAGAFALGGPNLLTRRWRLHNVRAIINVLTFPFDALFDSWMLYYSFINLDADKIAIPEWILVTYILLAIPWLIYEDATSKSHDD